LDIPTNFPSDWKPHQKNINRWIKMEKNRIAIEYFKSIAPNGQLKCHYCDRNIRIISFRELTEQKDRATIDHVIPSREGGTDDLENLVPSCFPCNYKKDN